MIKNIIHKINSCVYSKSNLRYFSAGIKFCKFQIMKIGTHDGTFHCDEVLACFMLKTLAEYKNAEIVRTRDLEQLRLCDIVVDVGGEFNHQTKRYDHHQREFNETLGSVRPELGDKYKIRLSSAGLVFAFYGESILKELTPNDNQLIQDNLQIIYKKVYENLIEEIDAIDNGVPIANEEPRYKIRTHLSARVGRLNPVWNSNFKVDVNKLFEQAMALVGEEFLCTVSYFTTVWLPARGNLKSSFEERFEVHESGQIIKFKISFPWKDHLFDLEQELGLNGEIKYVLFEDSSKWRVQAVPVAPTSFVLRKPLHEKWWGLRDQQLSDLSGIKDCIFCHGTGFIGGNLTVEGALAMAVASLNAN